MIYRGQKLTALGATVGGKKPCNDGNVGRGRRWWWCGRNRRDGSICRAHRYTAHGDSICHVDCPDHGVAGGRSGTAARSDRRSHRRDGSRADCIAVGGAGAMGCRCCGRPRDHRDATYTHVSSAGRDQSASCSCEQSFVELPIRPRCGRSRVSCIIRVR